VDLVGWQAFATAALPVIPQYFNNGRQQQVTDQVARRTALPQHHSIAALEQVRERVRQKLERRAFTFRNQRRGT